MQLGIYSFGETAVDPETGRAPQAGQRLRELVEEIELADQVGLEVFGVGEHHRPDFAVSAPAIVLAAAASRTRRIILTTAVTVLSSDDPVRVFQDFATLDQISEGRAEITAGRGSFIESFPLFGYDLNDYDTLFHEKLELLIQLRDEERVSWAGRHRPALDDQGVYPRPFQDKLPIWVAIGGTPASAARAARLGLPMAVAIIGGEPVRFAPLLDYYRDQAIRAGRNPATMPISINSHG
ncbi:MAG TPA: LLM class flavin-dependent oxidoreductase, partial [Acidisoma sp.]|nr:LLM class flavin-dependent oxidoreductase [Acidisoma sp.]